MTRTAERTALVKQARELGLKPLKKHTDAELEAMVASVSKVKGKKQSKPKAAAPTGWPEAWTEDQRRDFYLRMVHEDMPKDAGRAYQQVAEKMTDMVPHACVRPTPLGFDCLGVSYTPGFDCCDKLCPDTPLCKVLCEQRPELVQLANALAKTRGEVNSLDDDEVKEAVEAQESLQPKAKKSKKQSKGLKPAVKAKTASEVKAKAEAAYVWTGEHKPIRYKKAVDPEAIEVYRWMAKRTTRPFTREELVVRVSELADDREEAQEYADQTIEYLLEDGAIAREG